MLQKVLDEFMGIAAIPRPSHHEKKIADYLCSWAQAHSLPYVVDEIGNVIIEKPASPGHENAPRVILQAHMDMVCVAAEGVAFRPTEDAIRVVNDGRFISAEGTSLGADDGIGVAMALVVLAGQEAIHGPLRVLFTVNEEDGMSSGAIDPKYLDADYLINLDWEWLGSLCNSSAGGDFMAFTRSYESCAANEGWPVLRLEMTGLLGGHSGVDIHKGRANALRCLGRLLHELRLAQIDYQLVSFHGGQARNAIPASAEAKITLRPQHLPQAFRLLEKLSLECKAGFGEIEQSMTFRWALGSEDISAVVPAPETDALLRLLLTLPDGVHTVSPYVPGLTESSQNLGLLAVSEGEMRLAAMSRSCAAYRAKELLAIDRAIAAAFGFTFEQGEHSPAWAVNPKSRLTPLTCQVYKALTGQDMVVEPIHGALECGAFSEKNPRLDMIAIGPSLFDVHTPKERCALDSIRITMDLILGVLERLCA